MDPFLLPHKFGDQERQHRRQDKLDQHDLKKHDRPRLLSVS